MPLFPFDELMISWNAIRPIEGRFLFYVSVKINEWSPWLLYASWGSNGQSSFSNITQDGSIRVYQDALDILDGKKATGFQIKIISEGYAFPTDMGAFLVHFKHEMFSKEYGFSPYFCNKGIVYFGKGKSFLVPSQMVDLCGRVCEPTNPIIYTEVVEQHRRDGKSSSEFLNSLH
jgi:hypothetical protein